MLYRRNSFLYYLVCITLLQERFLEHYSVCLGGLGRFLPPRQHQRVSQVHRANHPGLHGASHSGHATSREGITSSYATTLDSMVPLTQVMLF
jgi:hypothetical protein